MAIVRVRVKMKVKPKPILVIGTGSVCGAVYSAAFTTKVNEKYKMVLKRNKFFILYTI